MWLLLSVLVLATSFSLDPITETVYTREIITVVNNIGMFCDFHDFDSLIQYVFADQVLYSVSTPDNPNPKPILRNATDIVAEWKVMLAPPTFTQHNYANHRITFNSKTDADVLMYLTAHMVFGGTNDTMVVGYYTNHVKREDQEKGFWRVDVFAGHVRVSRNLN